MRTVSRSFLQRARKLLKKNEFAKKGDYIENELARGEKEKTSGAKEVDLVLMGRDNCLAESKEMQFIGRQQRRTSKQWRRRQRAKGRRKKENVIPRARCAKTTVVPAWTQKNVVIALEGAAQGEFIISPPKQQKRGGEMLLQAHTIVRTGGHGIVTAVQVLNLSAKPITIPSGRSMGNWELLPTRGEDGISAITALDDPSGDHQGAALLAALENGDDDKDCREEEVLQEDEVLRAHVEASCQHLSQDQRLALTVLLQKFKFTFRDEPGFTDTVQHSIPTGAARPVRGGRYRLSPHEKDIIREHVKEMLRLGVITPSKSAWAASVVLAPKKDGKLRFCVDYRRLNNITARDEFPLPRIDDTLDQLAGRRYFSALDLTSGYWQVPLREGDNEKTAFLTPDGLYQFERMPFGLANAPATFQRMMTHVLASLGYEYVLVYLDDVLVHSKTFSDHLVHLEAVLGCIQRANLSVKLRKCAFAQLRTKYLGHVISGEGIAPDPEKVAAVVEMTPPTSVTGVRSFVGFVSYYRRFIKDFATIARPLTNLTRKSVPFVWSAECQDAFEQLRDSLVQAPIMGAPDFSRPFVVRTDASFVGLGATLVQPRPDGGPPVVIAYASRTLRDCETRYSATSIECLGMKWATEQFRPYIFGREFTLETDHIALTWLLSTNHKNGRLQRTAMELQGHNMTIVHRPGLSMHDVDALSRLGRLSPIVASQNSPPAGDSSGGGGRRYDDGPRQMEAALLAEREESILAALQTSTDWTIYKAAGLNNPSSINKQRGGVNISVVRVNRPCKEEDISTAAPLSVPADDDTNFLDGEFLTRVRKFTDENVYYRNLRDRLGAPAPAPATTEDSKRLLLDLDRFIVRDGCLFLAERTDNGRRASVDRTRYRLWVPEPLRKDVLFANHDHVLSGGHLGVSRTYARIQRCYYWRGMHRSVEEWVHSCVPCATRKSPHGIRLPIRSLPCPAAPFQYVSVDVLGPFNAARGTGARYVVVYSCHLTRYVETLAIVDNDTITIARALVEKIMCRHGAPQVLLSDRGSPFLAPLAQEVYRLLRVKKFNTSAYRPQTNGLVERFNITLANMLSVFVDSKHADWDRFLPYLTWAYNTSPHSSTLDSPYFLLYGREARQPLDVLAQPQLSEADSISLDDYRMELLAGLRVAQEAGRAALQRSQQIREEQRRPQVTHSGMVTFNIGDSVMVQSPPVDRRGMTKKLSLTWSGPYKVVARRGNIMYEITSITGKTRFIAADRLKKFFDGDHPQAAESDYAGHFETAGPPLPTEAAPRYTKDDVTTNAHNGDVTTTGAGTKLRTAATDVVVEEGEERGGDDDDDGDDGKGGAPRRAAARRPTSLSRQASSEPPKKIWLSRRKAKKK